MIGIQGSGKSTFCRECLASYERINLDELHTRNKEQAAFEAAIAKGADLVIDNTNPAAADRKRYLNLARKAGYRTIGYFMQSVIRDCIERNHRRSGKERVPDTAVAATSNKLELPSPEEGFDELYFVSIRGDGFEISEWRNQ